MLKYAISFALPLLAVSWPAGTRAPALGAEIARTAAVVALITRQTQAFSDASATNDVATLKRLLDDHVVFVNENGEEGTKGDLTSGPATPQRRGSNRLVQRHLEVRVNGDVAVTTFVDELTQHIFGQTVRANFRSTEVWLDEAGSWKMVSSQTMALADDPPAVRLPASDLDAYAGTYMAGSSYTLRIARTGDGLTGSIGGGATFPLRAEVRDVLFVPGQPRLRRIIVRDAGGAITGLVSRREGHDIAFRRMP